MVRDTPSSIFDDLLSKGDQRLLITFPVPIPKNFSEKEVEELLQRQGYTRLHSRSKTLIEVVQDRVRIAPEDRARITEALESALKFGQGKVNVYLENGRFSGTRPTCIARNATSTTASRRRRCSRSTRRSAPASPAAASAA